MASKPNRPVYIMQTGDRILSDLAAREYLGQGLNRTPSQWQVCAAPFDPAQVKIEGQERVEEAPVYAVIGVRIIEGSLLLVQMDRKEGDATFHSYPNIEYEDSGDKIQQIIYPVGNGSFDSVPPHSELPISLKQLLRSTGSLPDSIPISVLDIDAKEKYPAIGYCVVSSASFIVVRYWVNGPTLK